MIDEVAKQWPMVTELLTVLLIAYLTYRDRKSAAFQEEWRSAELEQPVAGPAGTVVLPDDYQTQEAIEVMLKSIPKGAIIKRIEEGVASNGSKYRRVDWST